MEDATRTAVDELVVLSKYEGDPEPENEFERISIHNGVVVSHDNVENGEVTGPVEGSELLGADIGLLTTNTTGGDSNSNH